MRVVGVRRRREVTPLIQQQAGTGGRNARLENTARGKRATRHNTARNAPAGHAPRPGRNVRRMVTRCGGRYAAVTERSYTVLQNKNTATRAKAEAIKPLCRHVRTHEAYAVCCCHIEGGTNHARQRRERHAEIHKTHAREVCSRVAK